MVVNIALGERTGLDPSDDPDLGRTWFGWDPDASEEEVWGAQSRSVQVLGSRASGALCVAVISRSNLFGCRD